MGGQDGFFFMIGCNSAAKKQAARIKAENYQRSRGTPSLLPGTPVEKEPKDRVKKGTIPSKQDGPVNWILPALIRGLENVRPIPS